MEKQSNLQKGAALLFHRNGTPRIGIITSSCRANSKKAKVSVLGMGSQTTMATDTPVYELTVLVTEEVLNQLNQLASEEDEPTAA